jgi:hypothetical protein
VTVTFSVFEPDGVFDAAEPVVEVAAMLGEGGAGPIPFTLDETVPDDTEDTSLVEWSFVEGGDTDFAAAVVAAEGGVAMAEGALRSALMVVAPAAEGAGIWLL